MTSTYLLQPSAAPNNEPRVRKFHTLIFIFIPVIQDQNLIFTNNGFAFTNICKTLKTYTVLFFSSMKKYIL